MSKNLTSYSKPYHKLIQRESITTICMYNKFVNWAVAEFDLYLQEESFDLNIYVPNGWLNIEKYVNSKKELSVEITAECKSKKLCEQLLSETLSIYNHLLVSNLVKTMYFSASRFSF
ncbi:hypothetical protein [Mariniflexile sp.]|uniref:hypothetical protein n=1 Tax=Mariniflexile sp. TaxID=1979402 RepID=UPI004047472D